MGINADFAVYGLLNESPDKCRKCGNIIMERIPLFLLCLTAVVVAVEISAFSQEVSSQPPTIAAAPLDKRVVQCINNELCTAQEQLRLLDELTSDMHSDLQRISRTCMRKEYKNCFAPATNDVVQWHKIHSEMRDLAKNLELQYTAMARDKLRPSSTDTTGKQLNLLEPAAGPTPAPNPYTNPDQEQLQQNKQEWWQEWAPTDEANPYHNW
jgi:hypothetical protein